LHSPAVHQDPPASRAKECLEGARTPRPIPRDRLRFNASRLILFADLIPPLLLKECPCVLAADRSPTKIIKHD
jgi:hypothetical protein